MKLKPVSDDQNSGKDPGPESNPDPNPQPGAAEPPTTEAPEEEEEWHMDFVPTGFLPDSVYREMAWYGILQIRPLQHSTKNMLVSQLIWQHTHGRPHVITETNSQPTITPNKISKQIVAEEASKWSREQRNIQEVIMENIKTGGAGLTIRTVITKNATTTYMIQNGLFFKCPDDFEPDYYGYRNITILRNRKCISSKGDKSVQPVDYEPVKFDPCIEAEYSPLEYSVGEGWMFCFGSGERENNYGTDGKLECGDKTKMSAQDVLDQCAIDNNIVITYDYYGDEPRKEILHNSSLCVTWDPCHLSYLYRFEPPMNETVMLGTTENPCDVTVCEECQEGGDKKKRKGIVMPLDEADSPPSFDDNK